MVPVKTIAFVGLGNMGTPMAARLAAKGFTLALYDVRPEAVEAFVASHGGRAATSAADAARAADVAITMLPTDAVVRGVALGPDGLADGLEPGSILIDMSTSDPRATVETGAALAARGLRLIDAPVMGGVAFARDGSLVVLTGGADGDIARCLPVFEAVGRRVFRCGALGSAHALKAIANYVNATALINFIEAFAIGRKFGLDTATMVDALREMCTGRQHPFEKKVIPEVLTRNFTTGMALGLIAKDVSIAADFGRSIGVMTPLADCVCDIWGKAEAEVGGKADQTEVARLWEESSEVML